MKAQYLVETLVEVLEENKKETIEVMLAAILRTLEINDLKERNFSHYLADRKTI